MYKSRTKRLARVVSIALVAFTAGTAVPAVAGAATLPGQPAWNGSNDWWKQVQDWLKQAGWTLPGGGGAPQPPAPPSTPTSPPGGTSGGGTTTPLSGSAASFSGNYSNASGSRSYRGYVPSSYQKGTAMPLVVVLHGCTQDGDVMRQLTRFDQLAEAKGFIAVFPEQSSAGNSTKCWNFFQDAQIKRGSGEPSLIAGITSWVQQHYTVDPKRIYVTGLSAGGAMASVMGATYPDIYAAIGVESGCEYAAGAACAGYQSADPAQAAKSAYAAMGQYARVMPVVAFQGDADTTVPPVNGDQLVQQWTKTAQLVDSAKGGGSFSGTPTSKTDGQVPGGRSYTLSTYADSSGKAMIQYYLVHGMNHAWSGGCSCEQFSDPQGPDATAAMWQFFSEHPMP